MAYRAEIEIVAKGVAKIGQLQKNLNQLANQIDHLNGPGSLGDFNKQLAQATKLMSRAQQGTVEEKRAIEQYVVALNNANQAQARTNKLIAEEIRQRNGATIALRKYNAAAVPPRERGSMSGRYLRPLGRSQSAVSLGPQPDRTKMLRRQAVLDRTVRRTQQLSGLQQGLAKLSKVEADARLDAARSASQQVGEMAAISREAKKINQYSLPRVGPREPKADRRRRSGRQRFTDIATGAGFPLLFGGGPLQALAGGVGGAFGGLGGAIAGSAIVAQLEGFARAAAETGVALTSTAGALEFVREKSLFSSEQNRELAAQLEEQGNVAELATLLTDELVKKVGNSGVAALTDLGDTTKETTALWNQLTTQLQILISGPLNGFLKLVNNAIGGINEALKPTAKEDFTAIRDRILEGSDEAAKEQVLAIEAGVRGTTKRNLRGGGTQTIQGTLTEAGAATGLEQLKAAGLLPKIPVTLEDQRTFTPDAGAERLAERIKRQNQAAASRLAISKAELAIVKESSELSKIDLEFDLKRTRVQEKYTRLFSKALSDQEKSRLEQAQKLDLEILSVERNEKISNHMRDQFDALSKVTAEMQEMTSFTKELSDEFKSLANTINNEIINGIEGMIDGTKTLGQVASSMLKKIASQMLQTAIMGPSGSGGIGGMLLSGISSLFGGGASTAGPGGFTLPAGATPKFRAFANGGRPPVGRPSVVGERGPELFVPRTSGTIVPNEALGSGANVTVNVDASGSSVQGDGPSANQLGKAIGAAVQAELIKQKRPGGLLTR